MFWVDSICWKGGNVNKAHIVKDFDLIYLDALDHREVQQLIKACVKCLEIWNSLVPTYCSTRVTTILKNFISKIEYS